MTWQLLADKFLLRGSGEHYFFYQLGHGITIDRGRDVDLSEEVLWLNGSVYSAIASINGLLPIHASAVTVGGQVFAFTGPAGAGKSTLVAALASHGLPLFCDDTLVLDLSDSSRIICLPGHKRLKLTPEAIELTGAKAEEKVCQTYDKYYATPPGGASTTALPLAELIFLEEGPEQSITPIRGSERLVKLQDNHQTTRLFAEARRFNRAEHFRHLTRLALHIRLTRFARPHDPSSFEEGVALAHQYVTRRARTTLHRSENDADQQID